MEPIGLNVGGFYLTALDEPSWLADRAYTWAVREASTGDPIGEITLMPGGQVCARGADSAGLTTAVGAVRRFAAAL